MAKGRRRNQPKHNQRKRVPSPPASTAKSVPGWAAAPEFESRQISWKFSKADKGGKWPWSAFPDDRLGDLFSRLAHFETMEPKVLKSGRQLSIHPISSLAKDAHARLREIGRDDLDRLFSFHFGRTERVWCCEYQSIMFILWWDPDHTVYPTRKKRT